MERADGTGRAALRVEAHAVTFPGGGDEIEVAVGVGVDGDGGGRSNTTGGVCVGEGLVGAPAYALKHADPAVARRSDHEVHQTVVVHVGELQAVDPPHVVGDPGLRLELAVGPSEARDYAGLVGAGEEDVDVLRARRQRDDARLKPMPVS